MDSKGRRRPRADDNRIAIQSTEDDEVDNFFSKQLAAARFHNNHRLINTLFSETVVEIDQTPDAEKLQACKKRIKSLTEYQIRLDKEISELNDRFIATKSKIKDDGEKFAQHLSSTIEKHKKELEVAKVDAEIRHQRELVVKQCLQDMLSQFDTEEPTQ